MIVVTRGGCREPRCPGVDGDRRQRRAPASRRVVAEQFEISADEGIDGAVGRGDEPVVELEQGDIPGGEREPAPISACAIRVISESVRNLDQT